jgi:hypothetical protein
LLVGPVTLIQAGGRDDFVAVCHAELGSGLGVGLGNLLHVL